MSSVERQIEMIKALNRTLELAQIGAMGLIVDDRRRLYRVVEADVLRLIAIYAGRVEA